MELTLDEINLLLDSFEERSMQKLHLKRGDFELLLERSSNNPVVAPASLHHSIAPHAPMPPTHLPPHFPAHDKVAESQSEAVDTNAKFISSPMVGTFYQAPAPGEPNFVSIGDTVKKGDVVCIIEAMKVMNEVKATESGVLKEILVEDGHPVEFGTKIFKLG